MTEPSRTDYDGAGDLGQRALAGLNWTYAATIGSLVLQLGYTAVMGRLLSPVAFGLVASAQVVLVLGQFVAEFGMGSALVQRDGLTRDDIRAGFTSSTLLGALLAAVMAGAAPLVGAVFGEADIVPVLRVLALTPLLNGVGLTGLNLLRRQLRFRAYALLQVGSYLAGYLFVGIGLGLAGAGVWSLVAAALVQNGLRTLGGYVLTRHPARPLLAWGRLRGLYSFGGKVSLLSLLESAGGWVPAVVISRASGQAALGQFNRANLLVELPFVHLSTSLSQVLFPALSRMQDDRDRVRAVYELAVRASGALLLPVAAGIAVAAPQLVRFVLGDQWDAAASALPALALGAAFAVLSHYGGIVCEALATLGAKIVLQTSVVVLLVVGMVVNPVGGLVGYAVVVLVVELLRQVGYAAIMRRVLALPLRRHARLWAGPVAAAGIVAAAIALWSGATAPRLALPLVVAGQTVVGAGTLAGLFWYGPLRGVRDELVERLMTVGAEQRSGVLRIIVRALRVGMPSPRPYEVGLEGTESPLPASAEDG